MCRVDQCDELVVCRDHYNVTSWSCAELTVIRRLHSLSAVCGVQFVTLTVVCLFVRALAGKRLELSTPNLVHVYSIAVVWHARTQRSKGQRSRSHGYENRLLVTIVRIPQPYAVLLDSLHLCIKHVANRWNCVVWLTYLSVIEMTVISSWHRNVY